MDRRKFLSWVGVGGIASYLPMAIVACSPQSQDNQNSSTSSTNTANKPPKLDKTPRADGFVAIATVADLEKKGQIVKRVNDVIVFRDPNTSKLVALKSLCTHQGCTVKWDEGDDNLGCACHGSAFDKDGKAIQGPASKPLDVYEAKEEKGIILVNLTKS